MGKKSDKPNLTLKDGTKMWWDEDGKRHRLNGPAVEWGSGGGEWCINGMLHRENGPAITYTDGSESWWLFGERHREDGPAVTHTSTGVKEWWIDGVRQPDKVEKTNWKKEGF